LMSRRGKKFTDLEKEMIYTLWKVRNASNKEIAELFECSPNRVGRIARSVRNKRDRAYAFVIHIEQHLKGMNLKDVCCKCCGKTIDLIYEEYLEAWGE